MYPNFVKAGSILTLLLALSGGLLPWKAGVNPAFPENPSALQRDSIVPANETTPPISSDDYWELVRLTRAQLASVQDQPASAVRQACLDLAERWEGVQTIQLPDGSRIPIDSGYLVTELRLDPPAPDRLAAALDALLEGQQSWPTRDYAPGDRQAVEEILSRPEFQWEGAGAPSPFQAFLEKLSRRLIAFLDRLFGSPVWEQASAPLRVAIIAVGALAVVLVLFYALRGLRASLTGEAELDLPEQAAGAELTAELALRKAQEMSAGGDYRQAVRYLYLSTLLALAERGLLRYDRARTNREYLHSLAYMPELSAELGEVVEVFDRVWYGYQQLDWPAFENYAARVESLRGRR